MGRRLVEWLEKPALVAGVAAVFLEVRESNHGAQTFYERLGYRQLARLANYYQGRESAIRMGHEIGRWDQPRPDVWDGLLQRLHLRAAPSICASVKSKTSVRSRVPPSRVMVKRSYPIGFCT